MNKQVQKVNAVGGNALTLNSNIKDKDKAIKSVQTSVYIYIFISPEFATTLFFCLLL